MTEFPRIKITLDHMRQEIVHAFAPRNEEIESVVADTLANLMETFDFQATVSQVARQVLEDEIMQYFMRGEGRHFIHQTIWAALDRAYNPDMVEPETDSSLAVAIVDDVVAALKPAIDDLEAALDWISATDPWKDDGEFQDAVANLKRAQQQLALLEGLARAGEDADA